MATVGNVQELNRDLARRINQEAMSNPKSPYAKKFVGIANGQVAVISDHFTDMIQRLRQIEPDSTRTFGVEASHDYSVVEEIWELC
jgi:hypothetical protein